jgi:hypothetical protein
MISSFQHSRKEAVSMGYLTKVQVIERAKGQRQFYLICPAPLAQALEMEKGETIEWVVQDKWTLSVRRVEAREAQAQRRSHGKG